MAYYFDYAATSLKKPKSVASAVYEMLASGSYGNPARGANEFSLESYRIVYETRERLADFFNIPDASQVGFTMNATMALNIALKGLLKPGDHVITTCFEHNSVLRPLYQLEKQGVELSFVGCEVPSGEIAYQDIENKLRSNTRMLVCTHASNVIGNLLDIRRLGKFCQKHNLLFVLDASQTAGVFPIDMVADQIDVLCFTGHKSLYGPQGIGGVCFREPLEIYPLLVGGSGVQSRNHNQPTELPTLLEAGTLNMPGIAGLNAAVKELQEKNILIIQEEQNRLAQKFYEGIKTLPSLKFYGDYKAAERSSVVTFNLSDYPSAEIADRLTDEFQIAIRPGLHCAPLLHERMGTEHQGMLRFSFSHYNTDEEIDYAIDAIHKIHQQAK